MYLELIVIILIIVIQKVVKVLDYVVNHKLAVNQKPAQQKDRLNLDKRIQILKFILQ